MNCKREEQLPLLKKTDFSIAIASNLFKPPCAKEQGGFCYAYCGFCFPIQALRRSAFKRHSTPQRVHKNTPHK